MKFLSKLTTTLIFSFLILPAFAQTCAHCNMDIKDAKFKAQATTTSGIVKYYDAIECLVNEVKTKNISDYKSLQVTDYTTGTLVDAISSYYLISKSLRSPMGANLSGYGTENAAKVMQKEKSGDVVNWSELLIRFKDSRFGEMDHIHHHHNRADMYGPAGIGGDHLHEKGGAMFSVKSMYMAMDGNSNAEKDLNNEEIFVNYMVAPEQMTMSMTMLGVMYAPSDRLTLMVMQGITNNKMSMQMKMMHMGMPAMYTDFETASTGLSDLKLTALIGLVSKHYSSLHINSGLSVPLGSVTRTDETPMAENAKLPYAMQIGSGTWDATIGATYRGNTEKISWGIQQLNTFRMGENSQGYNFGNKNSLNMWGALSISSMLSTSIRVEGVNYGAIQGKDAALNPMMAPTAMTKNYERQVVRSLIGLNTLLLNNSLLIGAEFGLNVVQNNMALFMNEKYVFNASVRYII